MSEPSPPADEPKTLLTDGRSVGTDELAPILYDDLRRMADAYFRREQPGVTLQPTALVHEAWMRLADQEKQDWSGRAHFLALAATTMRRVLSNAGRDRKRQKRGGDWQRVTLDEGSAGQGAAAVDLLDLDEALDALARFNERYVRIVELRYFAGLSLDEVAEVLGVGRTLVVREWGKAKAWLATKLEDIE